MDRVYRRERLRGKWMMISRRTRIALAAMAMAGLAACSSSSPDQEAAVQPSQSQMQPTGTPVSPQPISSQWRTVEGPDFTIGVPGSFTEEVVTASNGTKAYVFDAPHSDGEDTTLERVAVLRDEKPKSDVVQQSLVLEEMQSVNNEDEVKRAEVTWPGVEKAVIVQWTNPIGGPDGSRRETWQLMAQIDKDLIINVVAIAPEETFDKSELPKILATFTGR